MNFESREMFSSSNSSNPFPQLPPYFHLSSPSFPGQDGPDIFLNHHPDLLVSDLLSANYPVAETISGMAVSSKATTTNQETSGLNGHHCTPQNLLPRKKPGKKDRHSKIFTARGPRDRRVRLSIDIAHKFFHLQDMLGFDKASKTLEWLLTKSKAAIKELMQSLNSTFECEVVVSGTNEAADINGGLFGIVSKRKHLMSLSKEKKMKQTDKEAFYILARESRAKARARARERTREKMCTRRKLNDSKQIPSDSSPILDRSASLNQIEPSERTMGNSTVRKKKLKPSSIFNDQQNLAKDATSVNIPQNWDIDGNITRSSFCAMTNMNLFPEFQICSKLSEVCNNQSQC